MVRWECNRCGKRHKSNPEECKSCGHTVLQQHRKKGIISRIFGG